ncbi:DUF4290 domain-containing protein [uncultured Hymenobacter sp.]|uniref:DUF4290 domain-containing protein n=1 Tax=uncultured Hymenobacter sp. TaxID=170016 RepID=UPI0035CC1F76
MTDSNSLPFHLQLLVREYGNSTYQLIQSLAGIEDVAERSKRAQGIVQLMLRLQPSLREQPDIQVTLWSHVHALAGDDVQLEAPVVLKPVANRSAPPMKVQYPVQGPKLRPYGQAVEGLIAKAADLEDAAEREQAAIQIGRTMKFLYRQHNKENAKSLTILRHLTELSGGRLTLDAQRVEAEGLFETTAVPGTGSQGGNGGVGSSRPTPFIVPQPRPEAREERRPFGNKASGQGSFGGKDKRDKKRNKKNRQEPQQPPQ